MNMVPRGRQGQREQLIKLQVTVARDRTGVVHVEVDEEEGGGTGDFRTYVVTDGGSIAAKGATTRPEHLDLVREALRLFAGGGK